jgi:hypothetical protein
MNETGKIPTAHRRVLRSKGVESKEGSSYHGNKEDTIAAVFKTGALEDRCR